MNQIKVGFKLFFQSILFTFKHAQLFLYIGAYFVAHYLINYLLFPSFNLDVQSLNDGFNVTGNYTAGITSSLNLLFILGILFQVVSFIFFCVVIIAITDYTSHLLHNQSETIMHSIQKGLSHIGAIFSYGFLKLCFVFLGLLISAPILMPVMASLINNSANVSILRSAIALLVPIIIYLIYETLTFYFFPAITLSELSVFNALQKSWHLVLKTFLAIITFLIPWSILASFLGSWNPKHNPDIILPTDTNVSMLALLVFSIFSYTIFTVFKTILYEKANGTLPKQYDPEK